MLYHAKAFHIYKTDLMIIVMAFHTFQTGVLILVNALYINKWHSGSSNILIYNFTDILTFSTGDFDYPASFEVLGIVWGYFKKLLIKILNILPNVLSMHIVFHFSAWPIRLEYSKYINL